MGIITSLRANLVNTTGIASVGAVHATSTSSLDTRPASEGALQLRQSTRNLVTHSSMALVVVDRSSGSVMAGSVVTASRPRSLSGRCSRCGGTSDWVALGSSAAVVRAA